MESAHRNSAPWSGRLECVTGCVTTGTDSEWTSGASTDEFALSTGWQVISSLLRVREEVIGATFGCCQAPVDGVLAGGRFGIRMEGRALQRRESGCGQELLSGRVVRGSIQGIYTVGVLRASASTAHLSSPRTRSLRSGRNGAVSEPTPGLPCGARTVDRCRLARRFRRVRRNAVPGHPSSRAGNGWVELLGVLAPPRGHDG